MRRVFILGAGSSKAVINTAPLNDNLLPEALKFRDDWRIKNIKRFIADFYQLDTAPPLEDILTQLDICIAENRPVSDDYNLITLGRLREDLVYGICRVLQNALQKGSLNMMKQFVRGVQPDDTIISLNYDLIIDNSIIKANHQAPEYSFPVRYYLDNDEEGDWINLTTDFKRRPNHRPHDGGPITLLKLHGSLNWLYCPSCRVIDVSPGRKGAVYIFDRDNPVTCYDCGMRYDPYIVTPTFLKNYGDLYLGQIWQSAEDALRKADEIIFIGYSLPDADIVLRTMFSRAIYRNRVRPERGGTYPDIKVIDYRTDEQTANEDFSTCNRYRNLFGNIVEYDDSGFRADHPFLQFR